MQSAVINPANEEVITTLDLATDEDVDRAVTRSYAARTAWQRATPAHRSSVLREFARLVEMYGEELAGIESLNCGKPMADARADARSVRDVLHYYSSAPERLVGTQTPVAGGITLTFEQAMGTIGIIIPWNFPMMLAAWGSVPAIAAGNAVILKPSELAPLSVHRLIEIGIEAGLPEGLLQSVVGDGTVGEALIRHPGIAKVTFTGSTATGKRVAALAGSVLKPVTLELGGKSASIVFGDADLKAAAFGSTFVFHAAGQDCCARSRIYVEHRVFDEFLGLLDAEMKKLKVGRPSSPDSEIGPVMSKKQFDHVMSFLDGNSDIASQGTIPDGPGFFVPPTVLTPRDTNARALREEIFGPVVAVVPFTGESEAIQAANSSEYGLAGSLWTSDLSRGLRVAQSLECGVMSVNSSVSVRYATPFGGVKMSGFGRVLGPQAPYAYTSTRSVFLSVPELSTINS